MKISRLRRDIPFIHQEGIMNALQRMHINTMEQFIDMDINSLKCVKGINGDLVESLRNSQEKYKQIIFGRYFN